jgi:hypothetical protein
LARARAGLETDFDADFTEGRIGDVAERVGAAKIKTGPEFLTERPTPAQ